MSLIRLTAAVHAHLEAFLEPAMSAGTAHVLVDGAVPALLARVRPVLDDDAPVTNGTVG